MAFHGRLVDMFLEWSGAQTYVSCIVYVTKEICKTNIIPFNRKISWRGDSRSIGFLSADLWWCWAVREREVWLQEYPHTFKFAPRLSNVQMSWFAPKIAQERAECRVNEILCVGSGLQKTTVNSELVMWNTLKSKQNCLASNSDSNRCETTSVYLTSTKCVAVITRNMIIGTRLRKGKY